MRSSSVNRSGDCSGGKPIFYGKNFHGALNSPALTIPLYTSFFIFKSNSLAVIFRRQPSSANQLFVHEYRSKEAKKPAFPSFLVVTSGVRLLLGDLCITGLALPGDGCSSSLAYCMDILFVLMKWNV